MSVSVSLSYTHTITNLSLSLLLHNYNIDVGHALQTELKDCKASEKKLRELAGWLTYVEEAQYHVADGLERYVYIYIYMYV